MASSDWQTLEALKARNPRNNPICIGESIWISTDYNDGEGGLVEFHCPSGRITDIAKYPNGFQPIDHSMAGSVDHGILLVDGVKGKLITFDPVSKKYGTMVTIPKLGDGTSSLMIKGNVHIIHGSDNSKNQYLIYSMETEKVMEFEDNLNSPPMNGVTFTETDDDSVFYQFGGYNLGAKKYVCSEYLGALQKGDAAKPIIWVKDDCDSSRNVDCVRCLGTLQCGEFIIAFGGKWKETDDDDEYSVTEDVYSCDIHIVKDILNPQSTSVYKSKIECPMESSYVAVLDQQYRVHLFTRSSDSNRHYSIALKDIVPEFVAPPMTQRVMIEKKQIQQHLDDEKGGDQVVSSANLKFADLSCRLHSKTVNYILHVAARPIRNSPLYDHEQLSQQQDENAALKALNRSLEDEVERLKKTNSKLKVEHSQMVKENERMKVMNESLREELKRFQNEKKEDKVNELETKALDPTKFMEWDYDQILMWIMGLESGRFRKYEAVLKNSLSVNEVIGEDLSDVTALVLKAWGIKDRKDSKELNKHIQELVAQNQ